MIIICVTCFNIKETLYFTFIVYLYASYSSENKQRLFPKTVLTDLSLEWERIVFSVRYELTFYI
jgi:hypothetical protein